MGRAMRERPNPPTSTPAHATGPNAQHPKPASAQQNPEQGICSAGAGGVGLTGADDADALRAGASHAAPTSKASEAAEMTVTPSRSGVATSTVALWAAAGP